MVWEIVITLLLIILNGFFVAAEFALVKIRTSQLEILASGGNRKARLSLLILKNIDSYLSACQLGITIASLALGWIGEPLFEKGFARLFSSIDIEMKENVLEVIATTFSLTTLTMLHIVFGEQAPKMLAIQQSERVTLAISYPMRIFYFLFGPFVWLLNGLSNWLLKIFGLYTKSSGEKHSAEELKLIIDQGHDAGAIESGEHEIIKNAFGFDQITAKQIMVPRTKVHAIEIDTPAEDVIVQIISEGYSRLPVYSESLDNIEGIVYTKDILKIINSKKDINLRDVIRPAHFVPETKRISDLLRDLQEKRMHMAIVTDEYGGVSGIVTIEDIIEELVGEIQDEHDEETAIVEKVNENEYIVNASSPVADANEYLPHPIPEAEEYDTVAGYINMLFGKIPEQGEKILTDDYEISIVKKSRRIVLVARFTLLPEKNNEKENRNTSRV
ncbi:MAG: hemolysin family protein [Cytophagaceae bacterium]|nr:hemolysin family protein [Cytophagaceae bacterium]MDW8457437.1 hemolysin family protein [Cytophagaceae bacterium]